MARRHAIHQSRERQSGRCDGCLTQHNRPGTGFASAADHTFFREALQTFDCSIAGRRTYEAGRESILRARLYTEACALDLLDELWVTVEPIVFGQGVRMFEGRVDFRFELANSQALSGNTLLLKYRRPGG